MELEDLFASRYRIRRLIGKGGMAAVYEVTDEATGGIVALKRLLPEQAKRRAVALLFQREYNTLAQLSHPLVIRAFDYGVEGDTPYYTMELLSGENVRNLAPLPWREAASLVRDVTSALALVHSRRLVHRDVTPRNVCRTEDGRAKLIDFGTLSPMGRARNVLGTPPFLSPESLEEQPLDARSDLFSVGAVAYYLLTGENAYPARRIAELGLVWNKPVRPPSSRAPGVPAALDALVLSLINLNPLARPASAAEVFDRLTAIADLPKGEAPETARAYFLTPTLIAREDATQRFRRRLLRAERGRGSTLLIEAESGWGRSRLLGSFLLEAKLRGMIAARANADEREGAFGVVRALWRSLHAAEPALASELLDPAHSLSGVVGAGAPADAASPDSETWVSLAKDLAELFIELSRRRSTVLGIDDFDDCDGPSAAVMTALAEAAQNHPLLVVATATRGSRAPHTERMRRTGGSVGLLPFRPKDTTALLSAVFGDAQHVEPISDWVHRLSEGSPRTSLVLAQHLVDSGLARYREGGWSLPSSLDGLNLPQSIDQALDARVAALSEGAARLAEALALTSEDDPLVLSELAALSRDGNLRNIFRALNELVSAGVLVLSGSAYAFAHREAKEAVRRIVAKSRLPEIHRRIAHAYASGPEPVSTLAAYHLLEAGDHAEAFRAAVEAVNERTDYFARGNSFIRTPAGANAIETLFEWGRAHGMPAKELSLVARAVLQLASVGDARLARHAPAILGELERDSGLIHWKNFAEFDDPVARIQACVGEAYARYAAAPDRERLLDPGAAIQELATAVATMTGVYARSVDVTATAALDEMIAPLRPLSPALDVVGGVVNYAAGALRGHYTRDKRMRVAEQTKEPVPGIDDLSRVGIHLLGFYYIALEDALQGYASSDELVAQLDGHPAFAPLAWQARMLGHYYRGEEREAAECRRRRDLAMTGRLDIDGHIETSALYEASVYATLGDLMALKRLIPTLEERSVVRPGWRPFCYLARGNCHALRGEHEKAVDEYERGLALDGIPYEHTARILLIIRLLRSLVALGRGEEAHARAEAALARYEKEPFQALYVDQTELGLAAAEAVLGRTTDALLRAGAVVARAEKRGLSGVLLADFLSEQAVIANAAGDVARFEALVKRVGGLSAKTDSPAIAARYSRLLRLGQATEFGPLAAPREVFATDSAYTTLGMDVRTELELCRGPEERATHALRLLMEYSASAEGFLYLNRKNGFALVAALPEGEPTEELGHAVDHWLRLALDADITTRSASRSQPLTVESPSLFEILGVVTTLDGETVLAGVVALKAPSGRVKPVPSVVLTSVGKGLLQAGDATGITGLGVLEP